MFGEDVQHLRWFLLPSEALSYILEKSVPPRKHQCPVSVRREIVQLTREEIMQKVKVPPNILDSQQQRLSNSFENRTHKKSTFKNELPDVKSHSLVENHVRNEQPANFECCFITKTQNTAVSNSTINFGNTNPRFVSPPKRLFKLTLQAIEEFGMIENNDKVLVCLSGGKVINGCCKLVWFWLKPYSNYEDGINGRFL